MIPPHPPLAGDRSGLAPRVGDGPDGLAAMAAGLACAASLRTDLACARSDGRPGIDRGAGSSRYRLRCGFWCAWHLRPVCHHRRAAGVCDVWPEPHPGTGTGLVVGSIDPGRGPAAIGGRPATCHRAGRHDGIGIGGAVRRGGRRAAWLRHRIAVQANSLRLHEWHY